MADISNVNNSVINNLHQRLESLSCKLINAIISPERHCLLTYNSTYNDPITVLSNDLVGMKTGARFQHHGQGVEGIFARLSQNVLEHRKVCFVIDA